MLIFPALYCDRLWPIGIAVGRSRTHYILNPRCKKIAEGLLHQELAIAQALISSQNAPAAQREHLHRELATNTPSLSIAPNPFPGGVDERPAYYVFCILLRPQTYLPLLGKYFFNLLAPTSSHNASLHCKAC